MHPRLDRRTSLSKGLRSQSQQRILESALWVKGNRSVSGLLLQSNLRVWVSLLLWVLMFGCTSPQEESGLLAAEDDVAPPSLQVIASGRDSGLTKRPTPKLTPGNDVESTPDTSQGLDLHALPSSPPITGVSTDDFIGSEACETCHAEHYRLWRQSSHGLAGGLPGDGIIKAPFDGGKIKLKKGSITAVKDAQGFALIVKAPDRSATRHSIDGVVGAGLMHGGGGQSYFSKQEDGRLLLLPFEYNVPTKRWFCQTVGAQKWAPLSSEITLEDCGWPPERALGSVPGTNCQNCHGSQIMVRFDESQGQYDTEVKDFRINCESCHGPGRLHRERIDAGEHLKSGDIGFEPAALDNVWQSVDRCLTCHANKMVLAPWHLPGMEFHEFFATQTIWNVADRLTSFDGRLLRFGYQQAHLSSPCFKDGSMSCVDCHSPHSLSYRDIHGRPPADSMTVNARCHPSKNGPEHDKHPSHVELRCTQCHMAYHQPDNVGSHFSHRRSDHRISIPRPSSQHGGSSSARKRVIRTRQPNGWIQPWTKCMDY